MSKLLWFAVFALVVGCTGTIVEDNFVGLRHLQAGPVSASGAAQDCQGLSSEALCPDLPQLVQNYTQAVSWVVIATVDLDTRKYAESAAEVATCTTTGTSAATESYIPYLLFEPETWLKGDGSGIARLVIRGECTQMGKNGLCNSFDSGIWYFSSGRNLLFLAENCCLGQEADGAKVVVAAYPIDEHRVFDADGDAWDLDDAVTTINKAAQAGPPSFIVGDHGYYEWDSPCIAE